MLDKKILDDYIQDNLPASYEPDMLFILLDVNEHSLRYVYQNPFELIRVFWKEHVKYADMDETYRDTLAFLYHKSVELQYHVPYRKFEKMLADPTKVTMSDVNDAATLFLIQHSSLVPNLLFGHVTMPEERARLTYMFESIPLYNVDRLIDWVMQRADDHTVGTIRLAGLFSSREGKKIE